MTKTKKGSFFLASIIGAAVGAVGGLLLAPKSGKETRKDIVLLAQKISDQFKDSAVNTKKRLISVYGQATDTAKQKYAELQSTLSGKIASLKKAGQAIDKDKYSKIVDDVVAEFKSDFVNTKDGAKKMADLLKKDWLKIKKALV